MNFKFWKKKAKKFEAKVEKVDAKILKKAEEVDRKLYETGEKIKDKVADINQKFDDKVYDTKEKIKDKLDEVDGNLKKKIDALEDNLLMKKDEVMEEVVYIVEPVVDAINDKFEDMSNQTTKVPEDVSDLEKSGKINIQKYHVSQNKDKDAENFLKWRVRKESSTKTIQFFDTQKQAIDHAQSLADRAGSTVVIHKLDGSIRKQDYTKKG